MKTLREVRLKRSYDSDIDDILRDFYVPVLSQSVLYRRLTGFFSSTSFAIAAKGITKLISNGGQMKLITGARFRKTDIKAIREAYQNPESIIERMMVDEFDALENKFVEDHVRALGWMIANKKLEIKVVIVMDGDGHLLDERTVENLGIFHQKVGILEDKEGNQISFSGSENESAVSWLSNIEEFKVFKNWIEAEKEYLQTDLDKFEKYWNDNAGRARVIDIPTAVKEKLIEIAPDDIESLDLDRWLNIIKERKIELRDYQRDAINGWLKNDKIGIFEMATGTGKTIAALGCLDNIFKNERKIVAVIASPFIHLDKQWLRELDKFGIRYDIIIADSSNRGWKDKLADNILDIKNGISEKLIILTTHTTLASKDFIRLIKGIEEKLFLIADEVHGIGAPKRKTAMIGDYVFRLGLSATPKRWFDPEGTEKIYNYFGDVVFEFSLKNAIKAGYLVPYEYIPYFTCLTEEEIEKYEEETTKISQAYYQSKDDEEKEEWFSLLCIKRQDIIKNAVNKYSILKRILKEIRKIKHCLVYCSPQQINMVQDILNERNIIQHKFTQIEGIRSEEKYGGISERQFLLKEFSEGRYQALVAMRCLDEGVDIPPATTAIMMANSGNPREYIQRRGRVLRIFSGKEYAVIYDIIVVPSLHRDAAQELLDMEIRILTNELKRYKEFAYTAKNTVECLKKIEKLELKLFI